MAKGVGTFSPEEQAAAQIELKRYEESQKKIGIFTKIANRTVQKLEDIGAEEGESAEDKEKRLADQKVFGKIRDGVMKTGKAFDEFAGKYGKQVKEGGLKLLKGFAIGLIIISLLKFIKSPMFDDLLDALGSFFGFIDTLVDTFGKAATATLGLVLLFKPSLFMLPLKLAIGSLVGGFNLLTKETARTALKLKFTKMLGKLTTAGMAIKTSLIGLGQGLMTFATTTLMPLLVPLAPFIAIGALVAGALYSLYEGFLDFKESLASGDSLVDAIIAGVSKALATLISLPALAFQGLLEFVTGILGFDSLSERIGDVDIVGTVTSSIKNILTSAKDFLVDLFTFDTANFPSFGDFGSYAKRAIATLARNVLPEPGGFFSKLIPDSVYEFAGINPKTGEILNQQNTSGVDGVEASIAGEVTKLEEERDKNLEDQKYFASLNNKLVKMSGYEREIEESKLLLDIEHQKAVLEGKDNLNEQEQRKLERVKRISKRLELQGIIDIKDGDEDIVQALKTEAIQSSMFAAVDQTRINNLGANIEAVDDTKLITNQFAGMDIDVSGQTNETVKIVQSLKTKSSGIDAVAGGVKTQVDAITKLIDPEQVQAMRDKVARINEILKDGITDEEKRELATLGVNIRAGGRGRTLSEAVLSQRATNEAVATRETLLAANADMREVQNTASNMSSVVAPQYYTTSNKQDIIQPIIHSNTEPPAGVTAGAFK